LADYDWTKPTPGGSSGTWGAELNGILDVIQAHPGIKVVADATELAAYVPLLGQLVLQADTPKLYTCTNTTGPVWTEVGQTDSVLTTQGDIIVQGESAPGRLAIGTPKQVLRVNAGATAPEYVADVRGVCFSINNVDLATTQSVAITAPMALTITGGKLEVGTAPTGAALICDIHKNGTSLWTTQGNRPKITPVAGSIAYTITTNAVADDTVTIGGVVFTAVASGATGDQFDVGADTTATATNLTTALNANTTIKADYTATSANNVITLTEKIAGGGDTPTAATYTGTVVISSGTATTSSAPTSASITAPDVTSISQGDRLLLMIDQVGSTIKGKDLSVTLYCEVA